jgi:hypothetical protein
MEADALKVVLGMTAAYVASFAGMLFAWHAHRRRRRERQR